MTEWIKNNKKKFYGAIVMAIGAAATAFASAMGVEIPDWVTVMWKALTTQLGLG
mgnify:CR=1 FL=1